MSPRWRPYLLLLIAGLLVHGCVIAAVVVRTGRIDGYAFASLDAGEYYNLAVNLARHGWFSQDPAPPFTPDTWRTPGYPLFLAVLVRLIGSSPAGLVIAQQLLAVANLLLLYHLSRALLPPRRALVAALLFLVEPYHLYYSTWLLATTLFTTMVLMTWYTWERGLETRKSGWFAWAGLVSGAAVLVRPLALLLPLVIAAGLLGAAWVDRRRAVRKHPGGWALRSMVAFGFCVSLVVSSWCVRNLRVADNFALSHQGGIVLAYFKAAEIVLWAQGRAADRYVETSLDPARRDRPHSVWDEIDRRLQRRLDHLPPELGESLTWPRLAQGNRTRVDSFEISRALTAIAVELMSERPWATVACCTARAFYVLIFPLNLAIQPPPGAPPARLRHVLVGAPYVALLGLVLWQLVRGRVDLSAGYFPLFATMVLVAGATPQLDPRFRVPVLPLMLVIALACRRAGDRKAAPTPASLAPPPGPPSPLPRSRLRIPPGEEARDVPSRRR